MTDGLITEPYAQSAVLYRQAGWLGAIPVFGKHPPVQGFTGTDGRWPDEPQIARWIDDMAGNNIGLRLPETVLGIDVDAYDGRNGARTMEWFAEQIGVPLPHTWRSTSREDGDSGIYLFKVPPGRRWRSHLGRDSNVEIVRTHHRYAVCWPSVHPDTSRRYVWYQPDGSASFDVPDINSLAVLPDEWVEALTRDTLNAGGSLHSETTRGTGDHSREDVETIDVDGQPVNVAELLRSGIPIGEQNEVLYRYLSSMRARGFKREEMMILGGHVLNLSDIGDSANPWTPQDLTEMVNRVRREYSPGTSSLTGVSPELRDWAERVATARHEGVEVNEPPPLPIDATDMGNTLRFVKLMKNKVRYVADENRWYVWDGNRWAPDQTNQVMELTKIVLAELRADVSSGMIPEDLRDRWTRWVRDSEGIGRRRAILAGAESETSLVVTATQLDTNPWLLVCRNGTIDLRTGKLRTSDPNDLCTRRAEVDFDPDATAPRWKEHIKFITCGSEELAVYLMCMAGYSLTGLTSERSFYFLEGTGSNGKNVFIEPILSVMGSYATSTSSSLLTGGDEQHPTILADLRGRRFVFIDEVRQGKRLNVERIKALTGSKRIKARWMREDFFEFDAQFKLWIAGNGQPTLKDQSDGAWERMKRVPFDGKIVEGRIIKDYGELIYHDEASGILNWLLGGVVYWSEQHEKGITLPVPEQVKSAVAEHRHSEDDVERFLDEYPIVAAEQPGAYLTAQEIYHKYRDWALMDAGIRAIELPSDIGFAMRLKPKLPPFETKKVTPPGQRKQTGYLGLRWETDDVSPDEPDV